MLYYQKIINLLEQYFAQRDWKRLFLSGGCYWLADVLHQGINGSIIMINRMEEHYALYFERGLYDIRGRISANNFHAAGEREISFMKKNYRPKFDTDWVERYLALALRLQGNGIQSGAGGTVFSPSVDPVVDFE